MDGDPEVGSRGLILVRHRDGHVAESLTVLPAKLSPLVVAATRRRRNHQPPAEATT